MRHESARPRPRSVNGRKIRIDVNEPETPAPKKDRSKLMELFRALIGIPSCDRRSMPRHAAAEFAIWLGWWRGEQEFFALTARLVNISRGGALVTAIGPPPERHLVWICHSSPEPTECVEAKVLEVTRVRRREWALRLAFTEPCPHGLLEAALCGFASGARGAAPPRRFVEGR
jgi:hypothetical protein